MAPGHSPRGPRESRPIGIVFIYGLARVAPRGDLENGAGVLMRSGRGISQRDNAGIHYS